MSSPLPPKKDVALALLERSSVFVYLDPRRDGVVTPAGFKKDPKLVLQVGLNMAVPIHDLKFDDMGLSCTLSFNRTPFFCVVPWGAIFALTDDAGQGIVWPDDVPRELMEAQAQAQRRAALRVVPNDEPAPAPQPTEAPQPAAGDKSSKSPKKPSKKAKETVSTDEVRATRGKTKPASAESAKNAGEKAEKTSKAVAKKADAKAPKKAAKKVAAEAAEAAEKATKKAPAKKATAKEKPKKATSERKSEAAPPKPASVQPGLFDSPPPKPVPPPLPASATSPAPPAAPPSPPSPSPMRIGKTRRELPPYLRVVK